MVDNGSCPTCQELFALLDQSGETAAVLERVAEHAATCDMCQQAESTIAAHIAYYRFQMRAPLPEGMEERLLSRICSQFEDNQDWSKTMQQEQSSPDYAFGTTLDLPFDESINRVTAALKEEGFGVLTSIDMRKTLKEKLDVTFEPYTILGACNPVLAHRALQAVHGVGLLLPCNVVVHQHGEQTRVDIADPKAMLGIIPDDSLNEIAAEARAKLERVVQALAGGGTK